MLMPQLPKTRSGMRGSAEGSWRSHRGELLKPSRAPARRSRNVTGAAGEVQGSDDRVRGRRGKGTLDVQCHVAESPAEFCPTVLGGQDSGAIRWGI